MLPFKFVSMEFLMWIFTFGLYWMISSKVEKLAKAEINTSKRSDGRFLEVSQDDDLPDDPYMNYLFHPRLTFSGTFQSDVSTVNNIPSNFDVANFVQADYLKRGTVYNPQGTGEWNVNASVTQVCYINATCVAAESVGEPLIATRFQDGGYKAPPKMVDLDTEAQYFSEIWGWRIRVGDFFSADFTPVPFQYMWPKVIDYENVSSFGTAYQSVLSNIRWIDNEESSPLIMEWRRTMNNKNVESDKLSIRFNLDLYETETEKSTFTYGRVTGSIGLLGIKSPPFFSHGRMLHPQSRKVQNTPFIVDKKKQKLYIDFGNSFQVTGNGSFDTGILKNLYVGLIVNVTGLSALTCRSKMLWLGEVHQTASSWYTSSAGVQSFPGTGKMSEEEMNIIKNNPLVVAEVKGIWPTIHCKDILLAEALDGIDIHPFDDWTISKEPEKSAKIRLIATKFGQSLPDVKVKFERNNCPEVFEFGSTIGLPAISAPDDITTNLNGIAEFAIRTKDPKNPRNYIDGQIYPYTYYVEGQNKHFSLMCEDMFELLNHLIVIRVWDQYGAFPEPTWLQNVYPIFKQYAILYPVMTENILDLGNYHEVIEHKEIIRMSMELPISHPNYMPVTRDLSPSKRQVILDWLKKDDPPIGDPKVLYTIENLRKDLQTALQVEQATIPPYLTALASIKHNYNADVKSIIRSIVIQEMTHMNLVANILNAVGGRPVLYSKNIISYYPSRLPGGIQPDLVVPIEKVSISLIRNVFMKIEQPRVKQERNLFDFIHRRKYSGALKYWNHDSCSSKSMNRARSHKVDSDFKPHRCGSTEKSSENETFRQRFSKGHFKYEEHHDTVGDFYNHILNTLKYLTDRGRNNSIFTGDPSRQVDFRHRSLRGHSLKVTNFASAVEAIKQIVEQGEGSSPCNPMAWENGTVKDLSHYFLFNSIVEKRQIQVFRSGDQPEKKGSTLDTVVDLSEPRYLTVLNKANSNHLGKMYHTSLKSSSKSETRLVLWLCNGTYLFTGPKISFDPEGVWPMVSNPKMSKYKEGSKAYLMADRFNKIYTKMLKSLDYLYNGHPESLNDAIGLMYSVHVHLKKLLRTPIDPDGDPDVGPNAGPPFEFVP